jgi:hypothetical protein
MLNKTVLDRFFSKVAIPKDNGVSCWEWCGIITRKGYGRFKYGSSDEPAHRTSYEHFYQFIPDGFVVHHLCENKRCVNPLHLEAIMPDTHRKKHRNYGWRKEFCMYGHLRTDDNLTNGGNCRTCQKQYMKLYRQR